jgi:phage tail tape-measure protein
MPKHAKKMKARGGMARGGVQAASIGGDIGRWLGDWFQGWLGFAEGGEVLSKSEIREVVSDLSASEQNKLVKELTKDYKAAVKEGDVPLPAGAPAMSIGGDIGQWLGDWFQSWLGFAEGGSVHSRAMARGGMARGGMANYEEGGSLEDWNGKPLGKGERWEKIKSVFY